MTIQYPPVTAGLTEDKQYIKVDFEYNYTLVYFIKNLPTRKWIPPQPGVPGYNRFKLDLAVLRRIKEKFTSQEWLTFSITPELRDWVKKAARKEKVMRRLAMADEAKLAKVPADLTWYGPGGEKKELYPFQRADIRLMAMRHILNANQPGAGKTAEVILSLYEADLLHGYHLVNAPKASLELVWEAEITSLYKALGEQPPTVLTGVTPDERRAAIAEALELYKGGYSFWLLVNPAMIRVTEQIMLDGKDLSQRQFEELTGLQQMRVEREKYMENADLLDIDFTSFTIDEFHLMGLANRQTQGRKGCEEIRDYCKPSRMFCTSGTPIRGKTIKLFGALQFLYPKLFSNEWDWMQLWLDLERRDIDIRDETRRTIKAGDIIEGREEEFYDYHKPYMVRRVTKDVLPGMPDTQQVSVWCGMSKKQREQYNTFELEAEWRLQEGEEKGRRLTATNILAEYMRLKQFADGYCTVRELPNGKLVVEQTPDSGKLEQLLEKLAEEAVTDTSDPAPALIASQFNAMVYMVADVLTKMKIKVGIINGAVVARGEHIPVAKAFQAADISVIVLNTMAGTALNIPRAESVHILDETWVPDDQEQVEGRAFGGHRAMGKDDGRCYYYRTEKSIEEYIMEVCGGKAINNKMALDLRRKVQESLDVRSQV